ncbi:MAG: acyltransferase [Acidobacteriaceae bacterium]
MNPAPAETTLLAPAPTHSDASSLRYMPGLDLARGLAILLVLIDHGFAADQRPYLLHPTPFLLHFEYIARFGQMGVHLFFILSGFLITGILLDSRTQPDYFRNFYTRRVLRIAPAYLLMVAVLFLTHNITARYLAVCLLCLCNMPGLLGAPSQYAAFWSLSVEEQFYFVWPLVIRKLSLRSFTLLCTALVLLTPILRFGFLYGPTFFHDVRFKTWDVADFFAAGALLAITARLPHLRPRLHRAIAPLLLTGLALFLLQHLLPHPTSPTLINLRHATFVEPWLFAFTGFVLLLYLHPAIATHILCRPFIFLAKISYGLYLCHPILFDLIDAHWPLHGSNLFPQLLLRFFAEAAIAIAIAALSRYTFEEFFLRLKPKHPPTSPHHRAVEKIA